jgi:hypothetical protein
MYDKLAEYYIESCGALCFLHTKFGSLRLVLMPDSWYQFQFVSPSDD